MRRAGRFAERTAGAFDVKTHLSRYVADAERGIVTIVTIRGRPAAKIIPATARVLLPESGAEDLVQRARLLRGRARRGPESLGDLINAGRR